MRALPNRVSFALSSMTALLALGTVGYRLIEGWGWFDCFYMTLITLATIGYGEPHDISTAGRAFTAFLIISGVGVVGYAVTLIAQSAIQGELLETWEKRRVQERLKKLKDHYVICGAGRVGLRVARGLDAEGCDFVVVDRDREQIDMFAANGWLALPGDATREDVLLSAGIERARGIVCALPSDADNVFIVLTARDLNERLRIVARVNDESTIPKMRKAGADKIISPLRTGAHQMVQALVRPTVAEFIEFATQTQDLDLVIEEVLVLPDSALAGRTLRDSDVRKTLDVILIAILRGGGEMLFNPTGETVVSAGDKIIAIGNRSGVNGLAELAARGRAAEPRK